MFSYKVNKVILRNMLSQSPEHFGGSFPKKDEYIDFCVHLVANGNTEMRVAKITYEFQ